MLVRMPSTRVCRSWWWWGRRRWQPDQWWLRWRFCEGISESWWWALNEPSNSSSRRLCIGWKEKVMLLVLVSAPYLHKRFFFSSSFVCHFCLVNHLSWSQMKFPNFIGFCNLHCSGKLLTSEEFRTSRTLAQCAPSVAKACSTCANKKKRLTKEWTE